MINLNPESYDFSSDPILESLVEDIKKSRIFNDVDVELFVDFPIYKGVEDNLLVSQLILVSEKHGIYSVYATDVNSYNVDELNDNDDELLDIANNIFARLIRNKKLASGFNQLKVPFQSILYAPNISAEDIEQFDFRNKCVTNYIDLENEFRVNELDIQKHLYFECISTIQGAKGLWKLADREVSKFGGESKVSKVKDIESQILLFDKKQQEGYISVPDGPQRVRGLAGSGKTVVLAMKAALTLIRSQSQSSRILYTYSTKNLFQHVQRLIQRFYREFDDDLSNLDRISIKHSWGGKTNSGVYYEACVEFGHRFLTFPEARSMAPPGADPFDFACKDLLDNAPIRPIYEYVFVDEAQDYNKNFIKLCTKLAKNNRVTLGSDVFQNIFQSKVPTASQIYDDGTQFVNEIYLDICYRTPLVVLVCAHSVGLGIHRRQVQKIETVEHWHSLGYRVLTKEQGYFDENEYIEIIRDIKNSPTLAQEPPDELIHLVKSNDMDDEVREVANRIINDINSEGLFPEDILVVCADDYRCGKYFRDLNLILADRQVSTNNIHAEKYAIGDFKIKGRVTLSTIHKAKGNEAYSVYLMGVDFLCHDLNVRNRNLIFTAFTRTKGWLTISGVGNIVDSLFEEIELSKRGSPYIRFNYPSAQEGEQIEHDLQVAENMNPKDLDDFEKLLEKYGSVEKLQAYLEEKKAKRGKK